MKYYRFPIVDHQSKNYFNLTEARNAYMVVLYLFDHFNVYYCVVCFRINLFFK
jgi:hypothetical protein